MVYIEGRFGKPDRVDYDSNVITDLKPVPGSVPKDQIETYLVNANRPQLERYQDLYREGQGVVPDVYIDYYIMPD